MANLTKYDEAFIAHALSVLRANGGNAKETARTLGVSRSTLRGWAGRMTNKTGRSKQVAPEMQQASDRELAGKFEKFLLRVLDLTDEEWQGKIGKASLRDLLQSADIATRSRALLSGGPTSRQESVRIEIIGGSVSLSDMAKRALSGTEQPKDMLPSMTVVEGTYKEETEQDKA